jgi:hypothetical protein
MKSTKQSQPALATVPNAKRKPAQELPEWLQGTWGEPTYELAIFDDGGGSTEIVPVNRTEYIALKVRLAELRGIVLTQEQIEALDNDVSLNQQREQENRAA